jgi:hypothetical protein
LATISDKPSVILAVKVRVRVTSLGEILPFGLLLGYFLGEICFVVDILRVQERLDVDVLNF